MFLVEDGAKAILYTGDIRGKTRFQQIIYITDRIDSRALVGKFFGPQPNRSPVLPWSEASRHNIFGHYFRES